ncbi:hypothetical protein [Acinetobacter brisouii]|uniref:hypothetical protein n=1 Tax=Acinetobacter brisouii TaxID=396323 RepID=UPI00148F1959|nr:hypothetical protein [Acinetobacter brisouii]
MTGLKQYPFQYLAFRCLLFLSFGLVEITAFLGKIAKIKERFPTIRNNILIIFGVKNESFQYIKFSHCCSSQTVGT